MLNHKKILTTFTALGGACLVAGVAAADFITSEEPMTNRSDHTTGFWKSLPVLTIGEEIDGYRAPGLPDGMGAFRLDASTVRVLVNHEISASRGYLYELANGTQLTGGRVTYLDLDRNTRRIKSIGAAYSTIIDRYGDVVADGSQISETSTPTTNGLDRPCSANLFFAGEYGLVDNIFFTGEETGGGQEFALDVNNGVLHCAPALGRAAWESATLLTPPDDFSIALLAGDDRSGSPLLLYVGNKDYYDDGSFLDRNGLAHGNLYVWVADGGLTSPEDFNGTGNAASGTFVEIPYYQPDMAGQPGFDDAGWATQDNQDAMASAAGAFQFSRPEDVHTNPANGMQVAFASTGRGSDFPSDNWGMLYVLEFGFGEDITCNVSVLYDGDDAGAGQFSDPDFGLRSPDNVEWAANGMIYAQEDKSTTPGSLFGGTSGREASVWQVNPETGELHRILEMDRSAVPAGLNDPSSNEIGNWESSGVIDVTDLFPTVHNETLLLLNVEAHSLQGEALGGSNQASDLVEGGQILFASSTNRANAISILPPNGGRGLNGDADDVHSLDAGSLTAGLALRVGPNPTTSATNVGFAIAEETEVSVSVYDASGRQVRVLAQGRRTAGEHVLVWDGRNGNGQDVDSGVYFIRLSTPTGADEAKVSVLR